MSAGLGTSTQTGIADLENQAGISRTTCGWRKPELARDAVRNYWRDVHSPAIARRAGVFSYRHLPYDAVRADLFAPVPGIDYEAPADAQLMWMSDVVYRDDAGVAEFMASPSDPAVTALLLADIEMIVESSTTYRSVGENSHTYLDRTGDAVPIGPCPRPTYSLYFRARSPEAQFRSALRDLATTWSSSPDVARLRLNLFDVPDMEAERKAGYPVKTHPVEQQYQAWMDLSLLRPEHHLSLDGIAEHVHTVHTYPVPAVYTFVHDGRATLIGVRGYAAHQAIDALSATHATDPALLRWMYGEIA